MKNHKGYKKFPAVLSIILILSMLISTGQMMLLPREAAAAPATTFTFNGFNASVGTPQIGWTTGNLGKTWTEGNWVPYQLIIDNVQTDYPDLVDFPGIGIQFDYTVGDTRFVDMIRSVQIGTTILTDTQGWPQSDGTPYPMGNLAQLKAAQNSTNESAWSGFALLNTTPDWSPTTQVNIPISGSPPGTTTDGQHQFTMTASQIKALVPSTTNTIVIYFQLHESQTLIWLNGLESGYNAAPTHVWGGWLYGYSIYTTPPDKRQGSSFVPGSSGHAMTNIIDVGQKTIPIPIPETTQNPEIHGTKYNDLNGNGVRDPDEPGLPGWTIDISATIEGIPFSASTTTGSDGSYAFLNLAAGTYTLSEVLQAGWTQTAPTPVPPGSYTIVLGDDDVALGKDFGNTCAPLDCTITTDADQVCSDSGNH
ncbi:SdrD B-like domain-containing protein, partial [Chloroflexota bacterium]